MSRRASGLGQLAHRAVSPLGLPNSTTEQSSAWGEVEGWRDGLLSIAWLSWVGRHTIAWSVDTA